MAQYMGLAGGMDTMLLGVLRGSWDFPARLHSMDQRFLMPSAHAGLPNT